MIHDRVADRADAVRRDQCRPPRERRAQRAQDLRFGVRVHRRQRVVEQHDARPARQRARQRGRCFCPPRQVDAALAEQRVVPAGKSSIVSTSCATSAAHAPGVRIVRAVGQVGCRSCR